MEEYKKYLKKKVLLLSSINSSIIIFLILGGLGFIKLKAIGSQEFGDFINGVQAGILILVFCFYIYYAVHYNWILKDDDRLKKSYIKEMDERTKVIREKSGGEVLQLCGIMVFIAGVIAAYINQVASLSF